MAELATIARPYADALFKAQSADLAGTAAWLDELAAVAIGDAVFGTKRVEPLPAIDTQPGLERTGRVVQARVDHPAVVRAGVHAGARMALEQAHRAARRRDRPCDR